MFRYKIYAPKGIYVNDMLPFHQDTHENEVVFPGGIRPENIVGAEQVLDGRPGPLKLGPFQKNDNFNPVAPNPNVPSDPGLEPPRSLDFSDDESTPTNSPSLRPVSLDSTPPRLTDDESTYFSDDEPTPTNSPRVQSVSLPPDLSDTPALSTPLVRDVDGEHPSASQSSEGAAVADLPPHRQSSMFEPGPAQTARASSSAEPVGAARTTRVDDSPVPQTPDGGVAKEVPSRAVYDVERRSDDNQSRDEEALRLAVDQAIRRVEQRQPPGRVAGPVNCVVLLEGLRETFHPDGVHPSRSVDDSAVPGAGMSTRFAGGGNWSREAEARIAPGAAWADLADWNEAESAARRAARAARSTS